MILYDTIIQSLQSEFLCEITNAFLQLIILIYLEELIMGSDMFRKRYAKYFEKLPDLDAYMSRIGLNGEKIPLTKAGLDKVLFAHLCNVPFENIDLFDYKKNVDFGIVELFDKVVTRRRGGYCFELNAIFMALLAELGFTVHPVGARIMMGGDESFLPAIAHRMTIVTIDGKRYVADVGFGMTNAPAASICIDDYDKQDISGETYTVEDRPYNNKMVIKHTADGPFNMFMFVPDPIPVIDFVHINFGMSATGFRMKRMSNLRRPGGAISVDGDIFRVIKNGEHTETPIPSAEDATKILTEKFGMILDQPLGDIAVNPEM